MRDPLPRMEGFLRTIRRQAERAREAERFVRVLVGGGVGLVAGLWTVALAARGSPTWGLGVALAVGGTVAMGAAIRSQIAV